MVITIRDFYYYCGGKIDSQKIIARKRRKRKLKQDIAKGKNLVTKSFPATLITTVIVGSSINPAVSTVPFQKNQLRVHKELQEINLLDFNTETLPKEKSIQEQVNSFIFWGQMQKVQQNMEAEALMAEAVKAQVEEEIRAKNFFSTMREMSIEGKLSVKLAKISDNLNVLSSLTESPAEAKEMELQIASQIEKLKLDLDEYPMQFKSLKLSLKSEKKRLKECKRLRKEYEKRIREYKKACESLKMKLSQTYISDNSMTSPIGLTELELVIFLTNIRDENGVLLTNNSELIAELAHAIAQQEGINELLPISIMIWETGWLKKCPSWYNNFGGLMKGGEMIRYSSIEKGVYWFMSTVKKNVKSSIYNMNETYCEMLDSSDYSWAEGVLSIMRQIVKQ